MTDVVASNTYAMRPAATVAKEVLSLYWNGSLPVNPGVIARDMGLRVVRRGEADYRFSGHYRVIDGEPVVEYNGSEPLVRRRFTVAHEIGHHILNHGERPRADSPDNFRTGVSDPKERAANQFAAELLMPAEALRTLVMSGQFTSIDELANAFGVSKVAMGYRLSNLRLAV